MTQVVVSWTIDFVTWPKRGTRKLVVDGVTWLCHYDACCAECSHDKVTLGRENHPHYLFIDTQSYYFDYTPSLIVAALKWALTWGWTSEHGPNDTVLPTEDGFEWVPR